MAKVDTLSPQERAIAEHLERFGSITSHTAINGYGVTRLSAVIWNLRHKKGFSIVSEALKVPSRYSQSTNVANYIYKGRIDENGVFIPYDKNRK